MVVVYHISISEVSLDIVKVFLYFPEPGNKIYAEINPNLNTGRQIINQQGAIAS